VVNVLRILHSLIGFVLCCLGPVALKADILAAINTPSGAPSSSVDFFDPTSVTFTSAFNAPVILEGLSFGPLGNDVYVSSAGAVLHYDENGNLLGATNLGKVDIVELSYYNGALYAATNTKKGSGIAILDPTTLAVVATYDVTKAGPLTGISVNSAGVYITGATGIKLYDFSANLLDKVTASAFGPVSAAPGAVFSSIADSSGYTIVGGYPDLSGPFPVAKLPAAPGIAAVDPDDFFFAFGPLIGFLSDTNPTNGYLGSDSDNFGNLAYSPSSVPEPGTFVLMGIAMASVLVYRKRT
jgi:hypothetical protein